MNRYNFNELKQIMFSNNNIYTQYIHIHIYVKMDRYIHIRMFSILILIMIPINLYNCD